VRISPARYRLIAAIALGLLIAIVITGAAVRLTGSGLGCDDWPNCNDTKLIDMSSSHTAIEQVNRLFTGAVALAVIAAVLGSLWRTPRRRDLVQLSVGLVAGVLGQIVLGGITVLVDLHPLAVQGHMLLSMVLVATAVVLLRRAGEPDGVVRRPTVSAPTRRLAWGVTIGTAVAIVAGTVVTGAGPHAGDEDVQRFDVAIEHAARVHGIAVMVTVAVALLLAWRVHRHADERSVLSNAISSWLFVAVLQGAIGYIQYFNDVPELLVGLHVAGATALWSMTVWLLLSTSSAGATARAATDPLLASV
jgi:cytochrome c oxidase assembly protein subunit 15